MTSDQETVDPTAADVRGPVRCCWCDRGARRARCVPRFWREVRRRSDGSPAQTPRGDAGPAGSGRPRRDARIPARRGSRRPRATRPWRQPGISMPPSAVSAGTRTHHVAKWGLEPESLLDEERYVIEVPTEMVLKLRVFGEHAHRVAEQTRGGLSARAQEDRQDAGGLGRSQDPVNDAARNGAEEVLARFLDGCSHLVGDPGLNLVTTGRRIPPARRASRSTRPAWSCARRSARARRGCCHETR